MDTACPEIHDYRLPHAIFLMNTEMQMSLYETSTNE
jgi:hypothetical protein